MAAGRSSRSSPSPWWAWGSRWWWSRAGAAPTTASELSLHIAEGPRVAGHAGLRGHLQLLPVPRGRGRPRGEPVPRQGDEREPARRAHQGVRARGLAGGAVPALSGADRLAELRALVLDQPARDR